MIRSAVCSLFLLLAAPVALAVTVGELPVGGGSSTLPGITGTPLTLISFARPALANGALTHGTFMWDGAPSAGCANAIKINLNTRALGPNTFNQISGAQFAGVTALPPGGSINFSVSSGSVFVYGAVTDNRTNDGSLTFARRW